MTSLYAPSIPLEFGTQYCFKNVSSTRELVKFHLTNLLMTYPGEKISDPEYGVGIKRFLFEQLTPDTKTRIDTTVQRSIEKYLGYLTDVRTTVISSTDTNVIGDNMVIVRIQYVIDRLNISDVLDLSLTSGQTDSFDTGGFY